MSATLGSVRFDVQLWGGGKVAPWLGRSPHRRTVALMLLSRLLN